MTTRAQRLLAALERGEEIPWQQIRLTIWGTRFGAWVDEHRPGEPPGIKRFTEVPMTVSEFLRWAQTLPEEDDIGGKAS